MSTDKLQSVLKDRGIALTGNRFVMDLPGNRTQTIFVADQAGELHLSSVVASPSVTLREGSMGLLRHNRYMDLVALGMDPRGRWIARTVLPPGPSKQEIALHLRVLAEVADRMEQVLSGQDRY